jgi:hypothetical protein
MDDAGLEPVDDPPDGGPAVIDARDGALTVVVLVGFTDGDSGALTVEPDPLVVIGMDVNAATTTDEPLFAGEDGATGEDRVGAVGAVGVVIAGELAATTVGAVGVTTVGVVGAVGVVIAGEFDATTVGAVGATTLGEVGAVTLGAVGDVGGRI